MGLRDLYDFSLIENEAEKMVIDELEKQLAPELLEDNEEWIMDLATYALNHLKPAYSVTLLGKMYAHSLEEGKYAAEVRKMVAEAIKKIPRT
ncbi:MAG: late competence development ComFB family protein [Spirochaetales bacterium]|nr:late competence development ComFB family protein [Spirochaetales bacterium]